MSTITGTSIISKAQIIVQDTTSIRWSTSEWLGWLNSGQREICIIKPNACTKIGIMPLSTGTKQTIPADGVLFLEFYRNMGVGGGTPGNAARKVPRQLLDAQVPGWHSATPAPSVQHYVFDPLATKNFYVYPPSDGSTSVEILYAAVPTDLPAAGSVISVDDTYETVLLDYLVYRAYMKDSEFVGNAERSLLARKAFDAALGVRQSVEAGSIAVANAKG